MADKDKDDVTVNVDDEDTISVDVSDDPNLEAEKEPVKAKEAKPKEPKVTKTPRVKPDADEPTGPTPEEALSQAQAYGKQQEEARRAAEATAANERSMREQAQRQASEAQQTAEQFRERADNSELAIIENGIASASRELEAHEAEYTRAAEAGEFAKMASIQTKLSKAAAALDRLENAKASFDANAKRGPTTEGRVEAPVAQTSNLDRYLSQFAPAAQTWLRQHPDCVPADVGGDAVKNSKMMAGHYLALSQQLQPNTPEYFRVIEDHMGAQPVQQQVVTSKAAEIQVAGTELSKTSVPKHIQPSAPVSRDAPNSGASRNVREVKLSKEQQEMARVSFPHLPEAQAYGQYARNLIELEAEGKIGRLTH